MAANFVGMILSIVTPLFVQWLSNIIVMNSGSALSTETKY